jgi:hypothetical protein
MAVLGSFTARPSHWLRAGLNQARRVGRVDRYDGSGIGSGFLVDGALFGAALGGLPIFVTCGFVLDHAPLPDATLLFEGMFDDASPRVTAKCQRVLVSSKPQELAYALLLLDRWPGKVPELLLAPESQTPHRKAFVVSYPYGGGLSVSLDDNELLGEIESPAAAPPNGPDPAHILRYRAPTQAGSSGGPVFNENWEILAVHVGRHTGFNYGVSIHAVVTDARDRLADVSIPPDEADRIRASAQASTPAQVEPDPAYFSVFISYSHDDSVFAHRLYNALQAQGIRAWLDVKQMLPGDDIYERVQEGIQLWDKVLLCASKSSLKSWWVDSEIDRAFMKERELFKKREKKLLALIPLMIDDYMLQEWVSGKAQEVRSRIAADFRGWQDEARFEEELKRLIRALRADTAARESAPP